MLFIHTTEKKSLLQNFISAVGATIHNVIRAGQMRRKKWLSSQERKGPRTAGRANMF